MVYEATGSIFFGWVKRAALWVIKRASEDWIKEIVRKEMKGIQKLEAYDIAYTDFSKHLSYGLSRYYQSLEDSEGKTYENFSVKNRKWIIARLNEIRQAKLRLIAICGPDIRSLLEKSGTEWLNDPKSFFLKAPEVEKKLIEIASKDRKSVEQML